MQDLLRAALDWLAGDPDPETRAALQAEIDSRDEEALRLSVGETLAFGTAGIRGEVGHGSNRMNRAIVIKTTAGLAAHLHTEGRADRGVVLGFDARPTSRVFAEDVAGVLAASNIAVRYFPEVTPTPVVAFAAKHLEAGAAVVITASHNPPADNGYKVYGQNAAQIIPPEDLEIAAGIHESGPAKDIARLGGVLSGASDLVRVVDASVLDAYYAEVLAARPAPIRSDLEFVYTPLHGVGGRVLKGLFAHAGHDGLRPVPSQWEPDGAFPTVRFPNPEEPGALDLAVSLAEERSAAAVLANDPDADRLAAAVPVDGRWRLLTGNELGILLGDQVLRGWRSKRRPILVNSIVSSPVLARLAERRGARHETTLTGFKWIVSAALALEQAGEGEFAFGFEEALGFTIGGTVRDKDGISAALAFADLVATEVDQGRSVLDRLAVIWEETGVWVSEQHSVVRKGVDGREAIAAAVERIGDAPPPTVADMTVTEVVDYRVGADARPPWLGAQDLVQLTLGSDGRILVRPSGTEPKLKVYVDLVADAGRDPHLRQRELQARAESVANIVVESLGI